MIVRKKRFLKVIQIIFLLLLMWLFIGVCFLKFDGYHRVYKTEKIHVKSVSNIKRENHSEIEITEIRKLIKHFNDEEYIRNYEKFGKIKKNTTILLVTVDNNIKHLQHLIISLSLVKSINKTLVIFSHSYFDEKINNLVQSIDFCRVLQMFYPYSVQVNPVQFPGPSNIDCHEFLDIDQATEINCSSALYPDIKGHYRNPIKAEKKHHWWWATNRLFEVLHCTLNYKGLVVFLDEFIYLSEDFLNTIWYMKNITQQNFPFNELYTFGSYLKPNERENPYHLELRSWDPKYYSRVVAFNMYMWISIASQYDSFCNIDDYTWLRSLYFISLNRKDGRRYRALTSIFPRVFDTRKCEIYSISDQPCDVVDSVATILNFVKANKNKLHIGNFEVYVTIDLHSNEVMFDYVDNEGGWNDPRDKRFCKDLTVDKVKKTILDIELEAQRSYST